MRRSNSDKREPEDFSEAEDRQRARAAIALYTVAAAMVTAGLLIDGCFQ